MTIHVLGIQLRPADTHTHTHTHLPGEAVGEIPQTGINKANVKSPIVKNAHCQVTMWCLTPSNGKQSRDRVVLLCIPTPSIHLGHCLPAVSVREEAYARAKLSESYPRGLLACLLYEGHWVRRAVWCGEGVRARVEGEDGMDEKGNPGACRFADGGER